MPSGVLLLDKPLGLSSNAALQRVRTLFGREKAGHVGSLDPLATGMLPICLGEATKIAGDILAGRKCYRFTVTLGSATTTGDAEGAVSHSAAVPSLDARQIAAVLPRFLGAQLQIPPMYSALKRDGQPLYKLARAGVSVARAPRAIELFELTLLDLAATTLELQAVCSKGTYIRVLAQDLAAALGTCGHVTALRRVYVEPFANQAMYCLEALGHALQRGEPAPLLTIDWPLQHLPLVRLDAQQTLRVMRGQQVATHRATAAPRVRIYGADGRFLGVGETDASGALQPRRLIDPAR